MKKWSLYMSAWRERKAVETDPVIFINSSCNHWLQRQLIQHLQQQKTR